MTSIERAVPWVVVVPVKVATEGKSRLAGVLDERVRAALVRAMALDTVDAALAASHVRRVLVVTADPALSGSSFGVVPEPARTSRPPLDAAVLAGVAAARAAAPGVAVAALLGDLPALQPADLDAALALAATVPRGFVADAEGTGTTLLTALGAVDPVPHFGTGSAAAHAAAGHVRLDVPLASSVRRDVDLPADLEALEATRVGRRTAALLARLLG
ncbi:2-phospho-L-lactate guanylyltransferase [Cellulomonas edaphi]|uniref:Phosphoenolpyruvate guanylyltransferase n=1 Tax=Cellulomonas edaphi TaxID=3053468 RepID=A0ABT7SAK5_9CELL|nr:2-phospho-L-lactate guanylyltransferase [Cellulomons edaphi]MDM7832662.1 2-phospho-L-lactate guanylyltransferase [Cellulomons edaphi]